MQFPQDIIAWRGITGIKMSNQASTTADSVTLRTQETSELRAQTDDFMYVALCGSAPLIYHSAQTRIVTQRKRVERRKGCLLFLNHTKYKGP